MSPEQKEEQSSHFEFASLPAVAEVEDLKTRKRIIELLEELDQAVVDREAVEAIEEGCKAELENLQAATNKPGFKYGSLCFVSQPTKGRKTLDRMLLMEHGVSAKVIKASYKEGKPGTRRTFKHLAEEE